MENVKELLMNVAGVICFCFALSVLIYVVNLINKEIDYVTQNTYVQHALYQYE